MSGLRVTKADHLASWGGSMSTASPLGGSTPPAAGAADVGGMQAPPKKPPDSCSSLNSCRRFGNMGPFLAQAPQLPKPSPLPVCRTIEDNPYKWEGAAPYSTDLKCSKKVPTWGGKLALGRLRVDIHHLALKEETEITIERIPAEDPNTFSIRDVYIIKPELVFERNTGMHLTIRMPTKEVGIWTAPRYVFLVEYRKGEFVTYCNNLNAILGDVTHIKALGVRYTGRISLRPWEDKAIFFMDDTINDHLIISPRASLEAVYQRVNGHPPESEEELSALSAILFPPLPASAYWSEADRQKMKEFYEMPPTGSSPPPDAGHRPDAGHQ